ncbi:MAG: transposase [Candidatus Lloydbacteria bacterium]|nr:transposase [Candidatus Lloydbacteria bacterium]
MPVSDLVEPKEFDFAVEILRKFFRAKGFVEVPTQHRLSILAACEDPSTIATVLYGGLPWPLAQTGQMWLEYELLRSPGAPGFYCVSYSFRQEPNPIPGRHDLTFPMFEFELKGDMDTLLTLEKELVAFLDIGHAENEASSPMIEIDYRNMAQRYGVSELKAEHETRMWETYGPTIFLKHFPMHTSPFWNMKNDGVVANKIDVILYGMETIGSAERSADPEEMRRQFYTISNGMYANILFSHFGKQRVEEELEAFLSFKFFPRCGGGIGMTRLIRALKLAGHLAEHI